MIDFSYAGRNSSWLHRRPAAVKLAALPILAVAVVALPSAWAVGVAAVALTAVYLSAGFGLRTLWRQIRPLRWIVLVLAVVHTLTREWEMAAAVSGKLLVTVALAGLLTLTTRTSDLLGALERVLRRIPRVDAERVALVFALTLRAIPVVAGLATDVRDAQRARGAGTDVRAYGVPLVVRSLRYSDALGEALVARGLDD